MTGNELLDGLKALSSEQLEQQVFISGHCCTELAVMVECSDHVNGAIHIVSNGGG